MLIFHDFAMARSRSSSTGKLTGIASKKRFTRGSTSATEMATTEALDAERSRNRFSAGNSSRQGSHQVAKKCTRTVRPLNVFKGTFSPFKSCREKSGFAGPPAGVSSAARAAECGHSEKHQRDRQGYEPARTRHWAELCAPKLGSRSINHAAIRGLPRDGVNSNRREWRGQFSAVRRSWSATSGHCSGWPSMLRCRRHFTASIKHRCKLTLVHAGTLLYES